jgi:putative phosphoesterase
MSNHFKIGVISDTHGFLDPLIKKLFQGVDHILHAGDIGPPHIVMELEEIAPVTAVMGNTDYGIDVRETELVTLAGQKILVHHIVSLPTPAPSIRERIASSQPDMVVFGHTHQAYSGTLDRTLYLNPGYSGRRKLNAQRSVAMVEIEGEKMDVKFLELDV